jgi:hypothetical protein
MIVAVATLAVTLAETPVLAQVTTGTVTGVVKDAQGAVVPGATAVLISESRTIRVAEAITTENGDFVFPNVPGDTYTLQITLEGFKTLKRSAIEVSPGDRVVIPAVHTGSGRFERDRDRER